MSVGQALGIADAVWDEKSTDHIAINTPGSQLDGVADTSDLHQTPAVGGTFTTTSFSTGLPEADDFWNGQVVAFTTGPNAGLSRRITDFANTDGVVTVSPALPLAPTDANLFVILPSLPVSGVVEALLDEALAELAAVPTATPKVRETLMWMYMKLRNKSVTDDSGSPTKHQVFDDAGVKIGEASVTDTGGGGLATRAKYA